RPREKIWDYYIASNVVGDRSATCHYCSKYWSCGHPGEMEAQLANICPDVPIDIKTYWQELLSTKIVNYKTFITKYSETFTNKHSKTFILKHSRISTIKPSRAFSINDQEIALPEVIEQTDTLTISEVIDITNSSIETDSQLKVNRSHSSNI
ncbi:12686_t:CDS:2, partial [Cetraspora pellucida]